MENINLENEMIIFELILPKIDTLPKFDINYINFSTNIEYICFSTLTILQPLLKIVNDIKIKNLYDEIFKNILEYSGNEKLFIKYKKNNNYFNYSPNEFDIEKKGGLIKSGSNIFNFSSIYMNYIDINYLKIINLIIKNKMNNIIIKFSTTNSTVTYHYLYLLCYLYDKVRIIKNIFDTPFRDTFHILCDDLNVKRSKEIDIIKIENLEKKIYNLFDDDNEIFDTFKQITNKFFEKLILLVSSYIFELKEIAEISYKNENNDRKVSNTAKSYTYFDKISNGESFIKSDLFDENFLK